MWKWTLLILPLSVAPLLAASQPATDSILLASDNWHSLTMEDGSGLYFDLIRAVYEPAKVKVVLSMVPYARSVSMVEKKQVDGWVASFMNEQSFPLYPTWHFDRNRQVAVSLRNGPAKYAGVESLRNRHVAWLRDFNLDKYIQVPMKFDEIDDLAGLFPMLTAKRMDYFIGAESDIRDAIKANKIDSTKYSLDFVIYLNLYLAFSNTPRGEHFRTIWDERMKKLHVDPAFLAIYTRYGYPVPFDKKP